jgi:UDP-glucuronate 4-epimerase
MTKVAVIGGAGFIGQRITSVLDSRNYDYYIYDLVHGDDIRDEFNLNSFFEKNKFDYVIHLAARAGVRNGDEYPTEYLSTNVIGTNNIIRMCKKHSVKKLIFYSSSSVLGGSKEIDGKVQYLNEESPYECHSLYAHTKMFGEQLIKDSGLNYIIIRPFTVYGEKGRGDMVIYKWINQIKAGLPISFFGDGNTSRGYTYVQDLARATIDLMELDKKENILVNLGGGEDVKLSSLLAIFTKVCGSKKINLEIDKLEMPKEDVSHSIADLSYANELIGFKPDNKFMQIVEKIVKNEL